MMAAATAALRAGTWGGERAQAEASRRDDLLTIACGAWLLGGIFVDGWAHNTRRLVESFFTPWHAILYTGYAANSLWLCWLVVRGWRAGRAGRAAIPRGYELGLAGALLFGLGGLGDMAWHVASGIETNLKALLSPTHLLLFAGGTLILTSPFRAAWSSRAIGESPRFTALLPALLSLIGAVSAISFMSMYFWATISDYHLRGTAAFAGRQAAWAEQLGIEGILLTNLLLLAPVLLALRRWHLPFGSVTLLFAANTALMGILDGSRPGAMLIVALAGGLAADALIARLRPGGARPGMLRLWAALAPAIFWGLYFGAGQLRAGLTWPPELWGGTIVLCSLSGLGLSLLVAPPALPAGATSA